MGPPSKKSPPTKPIHKRMYGVRLETTFTTILILACFSNIQKGEGISFQDNVSSFRGLFKMYSS